MDELDLEIMRAHSLHAIACGIARLKWLAAAERFELAMRRHDRALKANFNPAQPRDELGKWTDEGSTNGSQSRQGRLGQSLKTAPDQSLRTDLGDLQEIANDPAIRSEIHDAWRKSDPFGSSPQEHGFWISRNAETGELYARPFDNAGTDREIIPGPTPSDAVAFFHTHPNPSDGGFSPGPSFSDVRFADRVGLPGLLQSHYGMYYFGPPLKAPTPR